MIVNTDFLISPAYRVPPISTILRARFTSTKVPLRVPSRSGSATNSAASTTVNSGAKFSGGVSGVMNRLRAKRECQAYCVITRTGNR